MRRALLVRLDSAGDVLLTGPAVRAVAREAAVTILVSPRGEAAARLLPGVAEVLVWDCPLTGYQPPPVVPADVTALLARLRGKRFPTGLIFTSYHQSPLPVALLLKMAGVPWVAASSEDYPGSLLDLRHRWHDGHEVERALSLVAAAGFSPRPGETSLAVRQPLPVPVVPDLDPGQPFVVVHPGASVPARAPGAAQASRLVTELREAGWPVVVTGGSRELALTARVAGRAGVDFGGRTSFPELAGLLSSAACLISGNTGPAHLAAAVATPVVSLFAPVVPAKWWSPWGVPHRVLGHQGERCAGTGARQCPVPGHPCLDGVDPAEVVAAVTELAGLPDRRVTA